MSDLNPNAKADRLKMALRQNLRRRKEQARGREAISQAVTSGAAIAEAQGASSEPPETRPEAGAEATSALPLPTRSRAD